MNSFKIAAHEIRYAISVFRRETMRTWKFDHDDLVQEAAIKVAMYFQNDARMERFRSASDGERAALLRRVFATVTISLSKKNIALPQSGQWREGVDDPVLFDDHIVDPEPSAFEKISREQEAEDNRRFTAAVLRRLSAREKEAVMYRAGLIEKPAISRFTVQTYLARAKAKAKAVRRD